jgi:photosystem II stability/assembly factor-like uncharacterized protein
MCCLNADTVFVCGNAGKLLRTYDGGATWQKDSLLTKFNLQSVTVHKTGIGYVSGDSGTLFKTINYGENWSKVTSNIIDKINNMKFYNDSCGYANMNGSIFSTHDYGENWNLVHQFKYLTDFMCIGKDTLYVASFNGLFYSYNTGNKWDSTYFGPINNMSWLNDSVGYFAVGAIVKTINAGKTVYGIESQYVTNIICAVNDTVIYGSSFLSLSMLDISKTTNGGITWDVNPEFAPQKMSFINNDTGYVLCGQKIYKTTNGCIYTYKDCSDIIGVIDNSKLAYSIVAPNPMEFNTFICLPVTYTLAYYKLYNNLGQIVDENTITPTSNQILRGNKPPGIYILNIIDSKGNLIAKQKLLIN